MSTDIHTCATIQAQLSDRRRDTQVREHVGSCEDCRQFAATLDRILAAAPSGGAAPPDDLEHRLHAAVDRAEPRPPTRPAQSAVPSATRGGWWPRVAAVAATAAALAAVLVGITRPDPSSPDLAAMARRSTATPATFTFAGTLEVTRTASIAPSHVRQSPSPRMTAVPATRLVAASLQGPSEFPTVDLDVPDVQLPDIPVPTIPDPPSVPDTMAEALAELQTDLRRLGLPWDPNQPRVEVAYHGHGRTNGQGNTTFDVTFETEAADARTAHVVTSEHDVWIRTDSSPRWIRAQGQVGLRVGPVVVPLHPADLLEDLRRNADAAAAMDTPDGQRHAVVGSLGRIQAQTRNGTSITALAWDRETTAGAGLRIRAELQVQFEADPSATVQIPVDVVDIDQIPVDQRPALLPSR